MGTTQGGLTACRGRARLRVSAPRERTLPRTPHAGSARHAGNAPLPWHHLHIAPSLHRCFLLMLSCSAGAGTPSESRVRPRTPPRLDEGCFLACLVRTCLVRASGVPCCSSSDVAIQDDLSLQGRRDHEAANARKRGHPESRPPPPPSPSPAESGSCASAHRVKPPPHAVGACPFGSPTRTSKHHDSHAAQGPQPYMPASSTCSP